MFVTELETFVHKFHQLQNAGLNAYLDLDIRGGYAWVSLHLQLGHVPGPPHPQPSVYAPVGGACLRRKQKRAASRKQAEEAAKTAENFVQSVIAEEAPEKVTMDILDEVCEDEAYNNNVDNINENLIHSKGLQSAVIW